MVDNTSFQNNNNVVIFYGLVESIRKSHFKDLDRPAIREA